MWLPQPLQVILLQALQIAGLHMIAPLFTSCRIVEPRIPAPWGHLHAPDIAEISVFRALPDQRADRSHST
jgi:hypothetical protein